MAPAEPIASTTKLLNEAQAAGKLPTPPGVLIRLLELSRKADISARELADTIALDPGLSAKILRFVNSPLAGLRNKVSSLTQAVAMMGVRSVKMMALSFSAVYRGGRAFCKGFDQERFALESLACAIAARRICESRGVASPHEAFVAGLLSQIGRSVLASAFPDEYAEVLRQAASVPADLPSLEKVRFGENYAGIGGQLLRSWGLPEELCKAVENFRDDGCESDQEPLTVVLRAAEAAAAACCQESCSGGGHVDEFLNICQRDFSLNTEPAGELLNRTAEELETCRAAFELPPGKAKSPLEIEVEIRERIAELSIALHLENQTLAHQQADLIRRATTDALTGVGNRAAFDARLSLELERSARCQTAIALLMIDVDRFKSINDNYGHLAGDHVLKSVARMLDDNVRKVDYCARYGGEEFAVIAPCTPYNGVLQLAERLRQSVESMPVAWEGMQIRVTVSIGAILTETASGAAAAKELLGAADRLLYEAKCAGRNRVMSGRWPRADGSS